MQIINIQSERFGQWATPHQTIAVIAELSEGSRLHEYRFTVIGNAFSTSDFGREFNSGTVLYRPVYLRPTMTNRAFPPLCAHGNHAAKAEPGPPVHKSQPMSTQP
ncbi:hypothetical protein DPMN_165676 [Dreissena polymorpha]|uniref:Uncharacterized protein n=1 Tax=Dreissena polymorpha TaxID=45954 RepID=A0A9D4IUT8_DREPO|nr:hypothetical protein DPMN_165676 [Dreissena polymorpha]